MAPDSSTPRPSMPEGMYDRLVSIGLADALKELDLEAATEEVDKSLQPEILAAHLASVARHRLDIAGEEDRLSIVNGLLRQLAGDKEQLQGVRRLVSLRAPETPGQERRYPKAPLTPLGTPGLLTNATGESSLGHEIRGELASADSVDLLCAFIKWHGVRTMESELAAIARRGVPLRVITTTYMGATERRALDRLVRDFGAEVRISYEVARTRLHAKAWIFTRNTAHHTAYVGSSNLSSTAMLDGVEWNVRLTQNVTPALVSKMRATFETYWNSSAFEPYDPQRDGSRLDQALAEAGGGGRERETLTLSGLEVRPYPHQQEILEQLEVEREVHGRHRNLVVAATGTGKTVIAALDYRKICEATGRRPSLLFVAHRREILSQALRTYREVLSDSAFGELFTGVDRPDTWQHVFASIQSLRADTVSRFRADQFEVVVVDEFHHAEADSYRALLAHVEPLELLGLTATPERTDGKDVRSHFGNRTAAELRLWDALAADLLCPFHYFGIDDGTDLRNVAWRRGRYDSAQLENLFTGNDARARVVLQQLRDKVSNTREMRALGFCVGVSHADYMARVFNQAGIPAIAVNGATPADTRRAALRDLVDKRVNIIFSADLYNEGVDLPDVDTVLFLRPTESSTIFLQQLGRGLRRTPDKAVLTVLDFVGNQRAEFRYDVRFSAMTGIPRGRLAEHARNHFPVLPSGCQIMLDRQSEQRLLDTLRSQARATWGNVVSQLRAIGDVSLEEFLRLADIPLAEVIKGNHSWTEARVQAGFSSEALTDDERSLLKRVASLVHVDDPDRAAGYMELLRSATRYTDLSDVDQRWARMLLFSIWPSMPFDDFDTALAEIRCFPRVCSEMSEVIALGLSGATHIPRRLHGGVGMSALRSHARYTREEIAAALDYATLKRTPTSLMQGVFHATDWNADVLLVTLNKSESEFGPTTMYEDYAISQTLFHWQSQSTTRVTSPTGRRYVEQRARGNDILLFSRESKTWEFGKAVPYLLLGNVDYVSHEGEAPISLTWQLRRPMPESHFRIASAAG